MWVGSEAAHCSPPLGLIQSASRLLKMGRNEFFNGLLESDL